MILLSPGSLMITLMEYYFYSSVGRILKASGVRITSIKIDPYLNVDAGNISFLRMTFMPFTSLQQILLVIVSITDHHIEGTMSPFEHGETFVLDDGGETDLDLGNYER